jgi:predicted nucleic acid-binding Zn ribbon protein
MGPAGFEPATNRLCIPLQLSLPLSGLWAGLSLHPPEQGCLPSSLYTFLSTEAWLGITISCDLGFPEFDRFHLEITPQAALGSKSYRVYNTVIREQSNCIVCGAQLQGKQTKFCSIACKNKHHQSYESQKSRGLARKLRLVKAAGSCCSICGYHKNLAALVFHHTDSKDKDFKLDMRS